MAITVGLSGSGGTLPDTNETDLWLRSTSNQNPLEWRVKASGGTIIFRFYYSEDGFIQVPVEDGASEKLMSTTHNYWYKVTAQGSATMTPTWYPTVVGV